VFVAPPPGTTGKPPPLTVKVKFSRAVDIVAVCVVAGARHFEVSAGAAGYLCTASGRPLASENAAAETKSASESDAAISGKGTGEAGAGDGSPVVDDGTPGVDDGSPNAGDGSPGVDDGSPACANADVSPEPANTAAIDAANADSVPATESAPPPPEPFWPAAVETGEQAEALRAAQELVTVARARAPPLPQRPPVPPPANEVSFRAMSIAGSDKSRCYIARVSIVVRDPPAPRP
jgi:hypothetical protein